MSGDRAVLAVAGLAVVGLGAWVVLRNRGASSSPLIDDDDGPDTAPPKTKRAKRLGAAAAAARGVADMFAALV